MNSNLHKLLSNLHSIQNLRSDSSRKFERIHKIILSNIYKSSSVSIIFRIKLSSKVDSPSKRQKINSLLNEYILNKSKKGCNIQDLDNFNNRLSYDNLKLDCDLLLIQRTSSEKDKFSNQMSFPGGKVDSKDLSFLDCSIRETYEEVGLRLLHDYDNIKSRVICQLPYMESPLGSKYIVFSFVFVVFDLYDEVENEIRLCKREVSKLVFVPIDYFYMINTKESNLIVKSPILFRLINKKIIIEKILLDKSFTYIIHNDNHEEKEQLLYGMTLRLLLKILNFHRKDVYECRFELERFDYFSCLFIKGYDFFFDIFYNPVALYRILVKISMMICVYVVYKYFIQPKF